MAKKVYVGIDLGTTNTLVSYVKNDKIVTMKFDGKAILPSVLFINPADGSITVGEKAYLSGVSRPKYRIMSAKTYIGSEHRYNFTLENNKTISLSPTDVAAVVLNEVKNKIVRKMKLDESDEIYAVITTPAAFSFAQNEETIKAAETVGLHVLGTRPEPVAAAIASVSNIGANSTVFVVDIGGGTYDTAFITFDKNQTPSTICSEGNRMLGGDDFDRVLYIYARSLIEEEFGIDLSSFENSGMEEEDYNIMVGAVWNGVKEAKEALSTSTDYELVCRDLCVVPGYNNNQPVSFSFKITRDKFNELCSEIYRKIEKKLDDSIRAFEKKGHSMKEVTDLVLVGGSCYIPKLIDIVENKVGLQSVNRADKTTAVTQGAAVIADSWTTVGEQLGGVLSQSMGVEIAGGKFSKIIEKGRTYPCTTETDPQPHIYKTVKDNQTEVHIYIYAAAPDKEDIEDINQHEYYGDLVLDKIPKAPAGVQKIKVDFRFDNSQQLFVTAVDMTTHKQKTVSIQKGIKPKQHSSAPFAIDLLMDTSGSMSPRIATAKNACRHMINNIIDFNVNEMGITSFNSYVYNICDLMQDRKKLLLSLDDLSVGGQTDIESGMLQSTKKLKQSSKKKIIILVSDGSPYPNSHDRSVSISRDIRNKNDIRVATIFIGNDNSAGSIFARNIAAANVLPGNNEKVLYYTAHTIDDLGDIFEQIYADITKD